MLTRLRSFSFKDMNRLVLGAITLVVTGAVIATVFAIGSLGLLENRYEMSGIFADSAGIRRGDLVRLAGVEVGRVTRVSPDFEHGNVVIYWEVDDHVDLGPRTTAEISLQTLLGGTYIKLGGPVEEPYLRSMDADERRIPLARTKLPATIDQILNNATHAVEQLDVANVNELLAQLGHLTVDNQSTVGELAANLAAVTLAASQRQQQLQSLLDNAQQVSETLASKDAALAQLVDNASVLLGQISARRDELATLLGSGSSVVNSLSNLIRDHRAELDAILADLHATLAVSDRVLPQLNDGLAFVGPTFVGAASITLAGPWADAVGYGIGPFDLTQLATLLGLLP